MNKIYEACKLFLLFTHAVNPMTNFYQYFNNALEQTCNAFSFSLKSLMLITFFNNTSIIYNSTKI